MGMKITESKLRELIREEVQGMGTDKQNFEIMKQDIVDLISRHELTSGDVKESGGKIRFYLYNQDAPDLTSQARVVITIELEPSMAQMRDEHPEVFL